MSAAADYAKNHQSPLVPLLAKFNELAAADNYRGLAESFAAFVKEHGTTRYLASEPVPFKIAGRLVEKYGSSSAFTTYTLRHATWASDLRKALEAGPEAFVAFIGDVEAQVSDIASKTAKLS